MLKALFKVFEIILLSLNSLFNVRRTIEEVFGTLQKCNVLTTKPELLAITLKLCISDLMLVKPKCV